MNPLHAEDTLAARDAATAMLMNKDRASAELRSKLASRGFNPAAVELVVAELLGEGLLNDNRFAQNYVAYHAARGHGPVRIAAELRRRELQLTIIEAALYGGPDWGALARKVCRRKFGAQAPRSPAEKARQIRFLQYRGFSSDHIVAAVNADIEPD